MHKTAGPRSHRQCKMEASLEMVVLVKYLGNHSKTQLIYNKLGLRLDNSLKTSHRHSLLNLQGVVDF